MHFPFQKMVLVFCIISLLGIVVHAQEKPKLLHSFPTKPIGISDSKQFDALIPFLPGPGKKLSAEVIQRQNIKSYMMPVRKIESNGNLLAYTVATCLEYYINLDRNYKVNLSPDYISLNLSNDRSNFYPEDVFQFLIQEGTVSAAILPFGANQLTSGVYATEKYTIDNYLHLFKPVTRSYQRIFETRKALLKGHPVMIQLSADESLQQIQGDRFWNPKDKGTLSFPLIVVGYDETKSAFEATSCWGRKWGDNGYIWIKYEDFGKYATDGYVMVMPSEVDP